MHRLVKLLFISLILSAQGCQNLGNYITYPSILDEPAGQEQLNDLFLQGMEYQELNKHQQREKCNSLKQEYKNNPHWQTAWLLVYSLNSNFSCLNLNKTLVLMNKIQNTSGIHTQLLWLNQNQINLIKTLQKSNNSLQNQLNETEIQLQQVINKIQALRAIETSINKKLDNE